MYLIQRKTVFGIWDQSILKPVCSNTEPREHSGSVVE